MIWLILAVITLAVAGGLLFALLRPSKAETGGRIEYDVVVYRDQLKEIDEDADRGLISAEQATAGRSEIHRRMLAAEDAELRARAKAAHIDGRVWRYGAIALIAVVMPAGAFLFYSQLGSPDLPGRPYTEALKSSPDFINASDAKTLADQLKKAPTGQGYDKLAGLYFSARDYPHAVEAAHQAIELGATGAATWSELGESEVMAGGGEVTPEAISAFTNALAADSRSERSRFYIGLAEAQIGNQKHAVAIWRDLEKDSDPNAPWLPMLREHITAFSKEGGFDPTTIPPQAPDVQALKNSLAAMHKAMQAGRAAGGPQAN